MSETGPHPDGRRILALLDGELGPREAEAVSEHCETCEQCRRVREELASVGEVLRASSTSAPLRPVWPVVRDRLERADRPIRRAAFGAAAAAAVLAGVFLGMLVGSTGGRSAEGEGSYLWSAFGSNLADQGAGTLSGAYAQMGSEGRAGR